MIPLRARPLLCTVPGLVERILDGRKRQTRRLRPVGQPGDLLWIREPHALVPATAYAQSREEDGRRIAHTASPAGDTWCVYRDGWTRSQPGPWRPSIFLPRWACRVVIEITATRVEHLQAITCADVRAEGFSCPEHDFPGGMCVGFCSDLRHVFRESWDTLHARKGADWLANPLVHVVDFKVAWRAHD